MFVPLPSLTDRKGERMNGVMNYRSGDGLKRMIMRTDPVIMRTDPVINNEPQKYSV